MCYYIYNRGIDMESRMDKYYKRENALERSKKNVELYKDISSQIEGLDNLPIPDNANEIDINGLKKIISSRDEYRKAKEKGQVRPEQRTFAEEIKKEENKIYDINVLLEEAKKTSFKLNSEMREKRLPNTNFLTKLEDAEISSINSEVSVPPMENKKISNTDSLPLDILTDLKGSDNTIVTDPIIKDEITMIEKARDSETFYSGSFTFSKKDFDNDDLDESFIEKKSHVGLKVFFLILGLLILVAAIYFILTTYVL